MDLSRRINVGKEFAACFTQENSDRFAELLCDDVCMEYTRDSYQLSFAGKEQVIQKANELFFERVKGLAEFQFKKYSLKTDTKNDRIVVRTTIHVKGHDNSPIKFLGVHELYVKNEDENFRIYKIISANKSS